MANSPYYTIIINQYQFSMRANICGERVCLCVRSVRQHFLTYIDEIWHRDRVPPREDLDLPPTPPGAGGLKIGGPGVHTAQNMCFWENFSKQKLCNAPDSMGWVRSDKLWTSPRSLAAGPSARGRSATMVPWADWVETWQACYPHEDMVTEMF